MLSEIIAILSKSKSKPQSRSRNATKNRTSRTLATLKHNRSSKVTVSGGTKQFTNTDRDNNTNEVAVNIVRKQVDRSEDGRSKKTSNCGNAVLKPNIDVRDKFKSNTNNSKDLKIQTSSWQKRIAYSSTVNRVITVREKGRCRRGSVPEPKPERDLDAMGWVQPVTGKRGRQCSDGNGSECNANSENTTEEMKTYFGKRPRDVSPLNGEECEDTLPTNGESRLTNSNDDSDSNVPVNQSPGCSKKLQADQEYSQASVINSSESVEDKIEDYEEQLNQLKIRTSAPKLVKHSRIGSRRGPRVVAMRSRTAYPRVLSSSKLTKTTSVNSSKSTSESMVDSGCGSASTLVGGEQEGYVDIDCEEDHADSEESITDDISAATSIDVLPSSDNSTPDIVPAIRPSYFPNVPPYVNFCLHTERTEALPKEIQKHMKWRLSTITPVVVKKTLTNSGFRLLRKTVEWGGHWGRHMKAALFKTSLKDYQKLNHLPGTFQIGRKDRLWRNIQRYLTKFGKEEFGFMPRTFILPLETKQLKAAWDSDNKGQLWIVKPPAGARGTGIRVVNKWNQVPKKKPIIVQSYVSNPYLINDRKFDLRLYVLVTSFHPLKVYLYNDGLVRFAPVKYSNDSKRAGDRFMHLTNYSINKNCELYTQNEDADACVGHKWTLKTLWRHFLQEGINVELLWSQIEEIVIKTLITAEDPITTSSAHCLPNNYNGYELFGFDIILDTDLKPWLLEVNISPSLHSSSPLDLAVKGPMIKELFNIVGYHLPPKLSPVLKTMFVNSLDISLELETPVFDKRLYTNSLSKEEQTKHRLFKMKYEKRDEYLNTVIETLTPDDVRQLIVAEDELSQCDNFCRIFPTPSTHTYTPYFEMPRYYNLLFDSWETRYHEDRPEAVKRLIQLCRQKVHLQVPVNAGSMISESQVSNPVEATERMQTWEGESLPEEKCSTNSSSGCGTSDSNNRIVAEEADSSERILMKPDSPRKSGENEEASDEKSFITPTSTSTSTSISPVAAVLDNITNNSTRSLGSAWHEESRYNNNGRTPPTPNKVSDFPKGVCF